MYNYAVLAGLLIFSLGFTSAYADESFVDPDNLVFGPSSQPYLPRLASSFISDPLTGEPITPDSTKNYFLYTTNQGANIKSDEKQLVQFSDEQYYLVPDPQDRTANIFAVLLLAVPFGLLVYRLSDEDPIPVKYAKLSGVVVAFSMLSMFSMPLSIGNSFWGYASASTNPDVSIPNPVYSIYFDNTEGFSTNEALVILDQKNSAISLDGINDYIILDDSLPEKLDSFTVSTWVKPDYKKGSAETLSVISGVDAFDLSINNNNVGEHVAIFSIYDGIKWHSVSSHTAIPEQWTHISATYSDEKIKIFVNGVQENSKNMADGYSESYQIAESTQNIHPYISLKSDVLVGAFTPSIREEATLENHFSGLIDDVTLYDKLLSSDQISALDENNRTPDVIQNEVQSVQTQPEQTGTENEYGFVTSDDNPNDQKIEDVAAEGYKVKKPEEKKKKDKAVTEVAPEVTEDTLEVTEETPEVTTEVPEVTKESPETVTTFDESVTLIVTSSTTTVCHIPPGKPGNNTTLTIGESALEAHLRHGDVQPTCENPVNPSNVVLQAPESETFVADSNSLSTKLVRVSADTTATFTDLPPINSKLDYQWKLYGDVNGEMVDLTNDEDAALILLDIDSDSTLDRAEWSTIDGITEYYLVAKIILATDGLHLDSNRNYVDDIYYEIRAQDDIWTYPIPEGDYVRVTFEQPIDNSRDITVYARSIGSTVLEVYEKDGSELIATFDPISSAELSKAFLTNLIGVQDTFDILVTGDSIEFDLIIDPISYNKGVFNIGGSNTNGTWTTGNAGNGHNEGDWVSYQYEISGNAGDPIPSFNVVNNHYDPGQDAIFIDAYSNFRYCLDCELLPDGTHAPPKDNATEWIPFIPLEVNSKYVPGSGSTPGVCEGLDPLDTPSEFHCFKIDPTNATSELYNFTFPDGSLTGNENIIIFFQAHLSLSATWITGNEDAMDDPFSPYFVKPSPESNITAVYGVDHYDGWTAPFYFGVGATPGSSAQFKLQDQSAGPKGAITLPIPTVESTAFASITIIKDTIPDGPIDVDFSANNLPNSTFTLDDDGGIDNTYQNTTVFIGLTEGTYSVAEDLPLAGYTLTDIECDTVNPFQGNDNSPTITNLETGNATIFLENGDQVVCKFTNVENGKLKIIKKTIDGDDTFNFASNVTGLDNFDITTSDGMGMTLTQNVTGIFNVTEVGPDDWTLINATCNDGSPVNAINVSSAEEVTCTFWNKPANSFLKIIKNVTQTSTLSEDGIDFNFDINGTDSVSLHLNNTLLENMTEVMIVPRGNYNVTELGPPPGWKLRESGCNIYESNDGNQGTFKRTAANSQSFTLNPLELAECTFVNDNTAFVKIIKNTTINSPDVIDNLFNFTISGPTGIINTSVNVTAGSHSNMTEIFTIPAGNYNVTENKIDNWVLQDSICIVYPTINGTDPSGPAIFNVTDSNTENFDLEPWQLAICEFVNNNPVGYFTGGGRVNLNQTDDSTNNANISLIQGYDTVKIDKVTHGFELHCDSNSGPNNLEVNWLGTKFHLEQLDNALCYDDGTENEPPAQTQGNPNSRKPTLDVYYGEGYGRYDGQCGAYAKWVMDDNGEPGKIDQIVAMVIWNSTGHLVLNINPDQLDIDDTSKSGDWINSQNIFDEGEEWIDLEVGNHQWTPHPFKSHGKTHTTPCDPETISFDDRTPDGVDFLGWQNPFTYAFPPP